MTGFIYFLRCGDFIKIGFSANPKRRLRYLQTSTPFDFEFLGEHQGTRQHEQALHKIFASLRHRHEWFRTDQSILEIVRDGLPSIDVRVPPISALGDFLKLSKTTQKEFAEKIGATQVAVGHWVRGDRIPRTKYWRSISAATNGTVTPNNFYMMRSIAQSPQAPNS